MRIPEKVLGKDGIGRVEEFLGEKLRVVGSGDSKSVVFDKRQWLRMSEAVAKDDLILSESSTLVTRAYGRIIVYGQAAKGTPAGRMALIAALLSLNVSDPSMASNLSYLLD